MRRARELDPLNPLSYALSSQVAFQARDHAGALQHANRAIALDQEFWIGQQMRGQALEKLGDYDLALKALATAARLSGQNSKPISLTGYILGRSGRTAEARDLLGALEMASRQRYVPPYALALVHAGLGDADATFEWLDRAYAVRDVHLMFLTVDVKWDRYRTDPRFGDLLARCGFTTIGTRAGKGRINNLRAVQNSVSQDAPSNLRLRDGMWMQRLTDGTGAGQKNLARLIILNVTGGAADFPDPLPSIPTDDVDHGRVLTSAGAAAGLDL
jgi:tetratricopeptide (TPR) repeat protein